MKRNLLPYLIVILMLFGSAYGLYALWNSEGTVYYEGTEVCETKQDYIQLKRDCTSGDVILEDFVILASEPPILVKFKVKVPSYDYPFPYGERTLTGWWHKDVGGTIGFSAICLVTLSFLFLCSVYMLVRDGEH